MVDLPVFPEREGTAACRASRPLSRPGHSSKLRRAGPQTPSHRRRRCRFRV